MTGTVSSDLCVLFVLSCPVLSCHVLSCPVLYARCVATPGASDTVILPLNCKLTFNSGIPITIGGLVFNDGSSLDAPTGSTGLFRVTGTLTMGLASAIKFAFFELQANSLVLPSMQGIPPTIYL